MFSKKIKIVFYFNYLMNISNNEDEISRKSIIQII
jgi:hypothetical protein